MTESEKQICISETAREKDLSRFNIGSISTALSCRSSPKRDRGRSPGSFPEQRVVIEPSFNKASLDIGFLQKCKLFHIYPKFLDFKLSRREFQSTSVQLAVASKRIY